MNQRSAAIAALLLAGPTLGQQGAEAAVPCENLARLTLSETVVTAAENVAAGAFTAPGAPGRGMAAQQAFAKLPAFCRVALTSKPSADSEIKIEVWLPIAEWNGKLQAVGDGGLAGVIPYALMAPALAQGYVASGTDTGHVGGNASFMPGHPEKLVDFAYRSTHQMAVAAKAITAAFYGNPPTWSYYNACSGGGRHAVTSAQRYPSDFQGIVAGAASWDQARLDAARIGINLTVNRSPESQIPASKYPMIHSAVLQACDAADGVRDGVLENPRTCAFDYAALACKGADGPSCLTAPQVESAKVLTSAFKDPRSGRTLLESHMWPGAELQWATLGGPQPLTNSLERVRNFHLKEPAWSFRLENIATDVDRAVSMDGGLIASVDFNLKPFFDRGGKLLMWHGWSDPQVPAEHSVIFSNRVMRTVGAETERSLALFMLPGVGHCGGGSGPDTFDKMAAISEWVEQGRKPSRIVASHLSEGRVDRTRPLCPFPQVARYSGQGSTDEAANFACVVGAQSRVQLPFVDEGACPFEGCTYREWSVLADTQLFAERRADSRVVAVVKRGATVQAVTGVVITTKAGRAAVTRPATIGARRTSVQPGDSIELLNYLGEGYFKYWRDGAVDNEFFPDRASCNRSPALFETCAVQLREPPACVWWVQIRTRDGQVGWSREVDHFGNKDRFG